MDGFVCIFKYLQIFQNQRLSQAFSSKIKNNQSVKEKMQHFLQVFDFQHSLLFTEVHRLQISAVYGMVMPFLEFRFWGSAPAPVLQVAQGSRYCDCHQTHWQPTHWQRGRKGQLVAATTDRWSLNLPSLIVQKKTLRNIQTTSEHRGILHLKNRNHTLHKMSLCYWKQELYRLIFNWLAGRVKQLHLNDDEMLTF